MVASFFSALERPFPSKSFRLRVSRRTPAPGDNSHMHSVQHAPYKGKTPVARWLTSNWLWDNVTSRAIRTSRVGNWAPHPSLYDQSPDPAEEMPRP